LVRFIHTSDWQLGMKGRGLGEAGQIARQTRLESVRNVLKSAQDHEVDFLLLCGDVFEHNMISQEDVKRLVSIFNEYAGTPIYLLPGNHDMLGAGCIYNRGIFGRVRHLVILDTCDPVQVSDTFLHPCPVSSKFPRHDLTATIPVVHEVDGIHIGVAHGSVLGKLPVSNWEDVDLPIDISCVERTGIDYLALGHWHSQRTFEDNTGAPRIAYSGTHEQTNYGEDNAGYCLLVHIDGKGCPPQIRPIQTGQLKWTSRDFAMKDPASIQELKAYLESIREVDMVRLAFNGELPLELKEELDALLEFETTRHRHVRIELDSLDIKAPFRLETEVDLGDPVLNQTDVYLRTLLADENHPKSKKVITEAIMRLQRFAKEVEA